MVKTIPGLKILVVEDKVFWQDIIQDVLNYAIGEIGQKVEIVLVKSRIEAVKRIDDDPPHLLVVDLKLLNIPEDKDELHKEMGFYIIHYAHNKQIPTIVVSGEATPRNIVNLLRREGVINFFDKEYFSDDREIFIREVQKVLNAKLQDNSVDLQLASSLGKENQKSQETYLDFDLYIAPNGHAIASSREGESSSNIPTELPNNIRLSLKLIEHRETDSETIKEVGRSLYDWLFPGPIHTHLHQTEAVARREKAKLRLRLRIESNTIASLPLEFLYRQIGSYYLAVNPDTVLSRYLNLPLPPERVRRREEPLYMLVIIADPTDQTRLPPDEWEVIVKDALAKPLANGQMTLQTVKRATRREIRNALLQQKPDIVQFIGHGIYQGGKGFLALVDEQTDKTWLVDDEQFAGLYLGHDDNLGLISLATCESAKSDNPQGFQGIAPKLIERGVPAVLSMQYKVLIKTAKVFLEDFYTSVAARKPIDWATQSARNAISQQFGLDNREFATPVLYMRAEDGVVF